MFSRWKIDERYLINSERANNLESRNKREKQTYQFINWHNSTQIALVSVRIENFSIEAIKMSETSE